MCGVSSYAPGDDTAKDLSQSPSLAMYSCMEGMYAGCVELRSKSCLLTGAPAPCGLSKVWYTVHAAVRYKHASKSTHLVICENEYNVGTPAAWLTFCTLVCWLGLLLLCAVWEGAGC